ncbi:MAG TPA: hypothetical protein VJQ51_12670 [Burkholderiales bacterium]|nr:hypothetical protein [Burkholderiales bacterium]
MRWSAGVIVALTITTLGSPPSAAQGTGTYTPPRTREGQPDLQGIWQALNTASWDIQDHGATLGVPAGRGVVEGNEIPYTPAALAKKQENFKNRELLDPINKCFLPGVPRATYMPYPFQIVQQAERVAILHEYSRVIRYIYMNGNPHPPGHIDWYMGDSRGRWDGNTLVVDVTDFNDETWFDAAGNFHSDALHVVERFTRTGPDHMLYEVTIEDPKVFTRPWKMSMPLYRRQEKDIELLEYECGAYLLKQEWEKSDSRFLR